jgi:hypothetical protein
MCKRTSNARLKIRLLFDRAVTLTFEGQHPALYIYADVFLVDARKLDLNHNLVFIIVDVYHRLPTPYGEGFPFRAGWIKEVIERPGNLPNINSQAAIEP